MLSVIVALRNFVGISWGSPMNFQNSLLAIYVLGLDTLAKLTKLFNILLYIGPLCSCLVYGHYGSTEIRWFFSTKPTLLPSMKRLCTGQLNAATVLRNLKLQLLGFLFNSDGRKLNKIGTSLTLIELLWEIRVHQEVVVLLEMRRTTGSGVSLETLVLPPV